MGFEPKYGDPDNTLLFKIAEILNAGGGGGGGGSGVSSFNARTGAVSLTLADVTGALGYTPENVANKDTDGTLAANSDTKYPSQKAVKTYADGLVVGLLDDRGSYNASTNLFPATGGSGTAGAVLRGDLWFISVAGTLGGAAVKVGDSVRALANAPGQTAGNWSVLETNIGFVPENVANKSTDGTLAGNSDTLYASQKATKTYADAVASAASTAVGLRVLKAGDTMTGPLLFSPDNTVDIGAAGATRARRVYVGTEVVSPLFTGALTGHASLDLPLTGGTLTGALLFSVDNTIDIGALAATRPRTGYFGTSVIAPLFTGALTGAASLNVLKAGDTMTGLLTITQATANTSVFAPGGGSLTAANAQTFFDYSGTWNTSGAATAFKLNITNTASGAASLLFDAQASTISQFSIAKDGTTLVTRTQADTSGSVLALQKRGTTGDATAAIANGDTISSIEARGWDTSVQGTAYTFRALALETFTASAHGTRLVIGIPAIGSTTATARFDLRATALALSNGCTMNVALGTITAAQLVYDGSVTWNAAVTFTAHRVTVTNTSSNAASLLCNYIVGAASVFAVRVDGQVQKNGVELLNPLSVYAAGTVYTLTTTNAKITFGTTSPSLTITAPGTYALHGFVKINVTGATFAANQTVTVLIRRINNTAANVTNSGTTYFLPVMTTNTQTIALIQMKEIFYTTANSDDTLELWADISALPSAGTATVEAASFTVLRVS